MTVGGLLAPQTFGYLAGWVALAVAALLLERLAMLTRA